VIKYLVVHCSSSPQDRGDTAVMIHRWHQERDFNGIGYHRVILENGSIQLGRPDYWQGAHTRGHNHESLGVCLIGEGGDATPEQLDSLAKVLYDWLDDYPEAEVLGHRDLYIGKTCPGFDVRAWWSERL
jgi:N-acetylmuramoyl-L-alanine amidase